MTATPLLSLCCGAHPQGGVINERFGHRTGHCGLCGDHTTFAPGGVVEGVQVLRLPPLQGVAASGRDWHPALPYQLALWLSLGATLLGLAMWGRTVGCFDPFPAAGQAQGRTSGGQGGGEVGGGGRVGAQGGLGLHSLHHTPPAQLGIGVVDSSSRLN